MSADVIYQNSVLWILTDHTMFEGFADVTDYYSDVKAK